MCLSSFSMNTSADTVGSRKHAAEARGENFESLGVRKQLKRWSRFSFIFFAREDIPCGLNLGPGETQIGEHSGLGGQAPPETRSLYHSGTSECAQPKEGADL